MRFKVEVPEVHSLVTAKPVQEQSSTSDRHKKSHTPKRFEDSKYSLSYNEACSA